MRVVHPALSAGFAGHHDATMRQALSQFVAAPPCNMYWDVVSLPFSRGELGLRSAVLTANAAYWASWADSLHMIQRKHPALAGQNLQEMSQPHVAGSHIVAAAAAREELVRIGFEAPSWTRLAGGLCPVISDPEDQQLGMPGNGWQQAATDPVHFHLVESQVRPRLGETEQALLRSQGAPLSGVPFSCFPTSVLARFDSGLFRCRCGRFLDVFGHHRAACAEAGVLGRRCYALESAAARVCWEAGARVGTHILVRDLDLVPQGRPGH